MAPAYISNLLSMHNSSRSLRSSEERLLTVPRSRIKLRGDRAFSLVALKLWNSLPICTSEPLQHYMILYPKLKTFFCHAVILQRKKKSSRSITNSTIWINISSYDILHHGTIWERWKHLNSRWHGFTLTSGQRKSASLNIKIMCLKAQLQIIRQSHKRPL